MEKQHILPIFCALTSIFLLIGCASLSNAPATQLEDSRILDTSLTKGGDGLTEVTFIRERKFGGGGLRLRLFSDGHPFADLKSGDEVDIFLKPGIYQFSVLRQPHLWGQNLTPRSISSEILADRHYSFRVTFLEGNETILPASFYALQQSPTRMTVEQALNLLKIGSSQEEVRRVLGAAESTAFKITSTGRREIWGYSHGALIERFQGGAASFSYGMSMGAGGHVDKTIYFVFLDGSLIEVDDG